MHSDYVDNWEALPDGVQEALTPVLDRLDEAADLLFDRRLNLAFEAAVKEISIPGIVALTDGLRLLQALLTRRVDVADADAGRLRFDGAMDLTAYDLPLYTPCLYLSQVAHALDRENVRVWKPETATEIVGILRVMARYVRPEIEVERAVIAALVDFVLIHPETEDLIKQAAVADAPNERRIGTAAWRMVSRRPR